MTLSRLKNQSILLRIANTNPQLWPKMEAIWGGNFPLPNFLEKKIPKAYLINKRG